MKKAQTKARHFTFIIYPESIPEDWQECLEKMGVPMVVSPIHDLDESERDFEEMTSEEQALIESGHKVYKKAHYHVIYVARNPVTIESVRKKVKRNLGDKSLSHIEIVDNIAYVYKYLTHESKDAIKKKKHIYDKKDLLMINDFDIDRYVKLDESEKRSLKNELLQLVKEQHLVNVIDLMGYIDEHGEEHGFNNLNDILDVVTANAGGFRLWFEGNYQCGYRARYTKKINYETGEIK